MKTSAQIVIAVWLIWFLGMLFIAHRYFMGESLQISLVHMGLICAIALFVIWQRRGKRNSN
jgi:ABC-type nickel/cobalt efflux system permease component RcnA